MNAFYIERKNERETGGHPYFSDGVNEENVLGFFSVRRKREEKKNKEK